MTFEVGKASDWNFEGVIDIRSLEDLKKFSERIGDEDLIIEFKRVDGSSIPRIIIYDDYVE